jgi:hypothetical protein
MPHDGVLAGVLFLLTKKQTHKTWLVSSYLLNCPALQIGGRVGSVGSQLQLTTGCFPNSEDSIIWMMIFSTVSHG